MLQAFTGLVDAGGIGASTSEPGGNPDTESQETAQVSRQRVCV